MAAVFLAAPALAEAFKARLFVLLVRLAAFFAPARGAAAAFFFAGFLAAFARAPLAAAFARVGAAAFAAFRFRASPASGALLPTGFFLLVAIGDRV